MYAFFKKRDKEFVGFMEENPTADLYLSKDVGDINPLKVRWAGNFTEGKIVPIDTPVVDYDDKYIIYERNVKSNIGNRKINQHNLPTHKQLNALMEQVDFMCKELKIKKVDSFADCLNIIRAEIESMKAQIKNTIDNPDIYTYVKKSEEGKFLHDRIM